MLLLATVSMLLATSVPDADARPSRPVPANKSTAKKPVKKKVTANKTKRPRRKPAKKKRRKVVEKTESTAPRRPMP